MWRCASIRPGITVLPPASIVRPPAAAGADADTDAILPSFTTTAPRGITWPVPSMIRAVRDREVLGARAGCDQQRDGRRDAVKA